MIIGLMFVICLIFSYKYTNNLPISQLFLYFSYPELTLLLLPEGSSRKQPGGDQPERCSTAGEPLLRVRGIVRGKHRRRSTAVQV